MNTTADVSALAPFRHNLEEADDGVYELYRGGHCEGWAEIACEGDLTLDGSPELVIHQPRIVGLHLAGAGGHGIVRA